MIFSPVAAFYVSAFRRVCKFAQQVQRHGGTIEDFAPIWGQLPRRFADMAIMHSGFLRGCVFLFRAINRLPSLFVPCMAPREKFNAAKRNALRRARVVC